MIDLYIQQYGKRLYGLCLQLCSNKYDAEDLYQDTWIKVVQNIAKYDPEKDFEPWLTKICVNTYRNALRRVSRSPFFNHFHSNEEKDLTLKNIPTPEKEDFSFLYETINSLPGKLRITVVLFYFRDMDISSTATVLGVSPGTIKSRLNTARRKIKEVLQNEADLPF